MAVIQFLTRAATRNERKNSQSLEPDFLDIGIGGASPIRISKDVNDEFDFGGNGLANLGLDSTPTNYSPTDANKLADHLSAIDTALASAGGSEFSDSTFRVQDNSDATKQMAFEVSSVSTATTRTVTMPDADVNLGDIATNNDFRVDLQSSANGEGASLVTIEDAGSLFTATNVEAALAEVKGVADAALPTAGGTMSGNIDMGSNKITNLANPTSGDEAVNKGYVDSALAGLDFQPDVNDVVADANATAPGAGLPAAATGQRYILQSNTASLNAAWGTITGVGDNDIVEFDGTNWTVAYDVSAEGEGALTWDRDSNTFQRWDGTSWDEFGGLAGVTAGVGLSKTGSTLNVNLGAGILELPSDEVGIDFHADGGLFLTEDNSSASSTAAAQIAVKLDGSSLNKDANGLSVSDAGVTEAKLAASVAGDGLAGGAGSPLSVNVSDGLRILSDNVQRDDAIVAQNDDASSVSIRNIVRIEADGNFVLADKSDSGLDEGTRFAIVEDASIASAASGRVIVRSGALISGFSGLTPSAPVYLGASGAIVQNTTGFSVGTDSVVRIGYAHSASVIEFSPEYETLF